MNSYTRNIPSHHETRSLLSRRLFLAGSAACLALASADFVFPHAAHADELGDRIEEFQAIAEQIKELQLQLEEAADNYYKTQIIYDAAQAEVGKARIKIAGNTAKLSKLQDRLSQRIGTMYREGELGVLDVLMGSSSFEDFATKWDLVGRLNDGDAALAAQVRDLREKNEEEKKRLEESEKKAAQRFQEAERIRTEAEKKTAELEAIYEEISGQLEGLLGLDQFASLIDADDVLIIGNPRGIEPHPEVVDIAYSRIGCPYIWAAAGPDTFDCSGLVVWVFDKAGISGLPHYTESLYKLALYVGAVVPLQDIEPGDVLYRPGHVGIAAGAGGRPYIHAPNAGAYVRDTDSLAFSRFVCGLRFPGAGALSPEELAAVLAEINAEIVAEEEARKAEEDARRAEEEARKAEEEQRKQEEKEAQEERNRKQAEEEAAKAEAQAQAEAEAKVQAEAEETARKQAEEEAAKAEAQAQAEAEAKVQAEAEEARKKAEEEAARKAEEEARQQAEEVRKAEEEAAKKEAEDAARRQAEEAQAIAQAQAEAKAQHT